PVRAAASGDIVHTPFLRATVQEALTSSRLAGEISRRGSAACRRDRALASTAGSSRWRAPQGAPERKSMMRIYSKAPVGAAQAPGVVVIIHGPGLDTFIEDRVDDLTRHGYAAAAPDLYHRQPNDGADTMTR